MYTDSIADLLTRIRNAQRIGQQVTRVPVSKMAARLLQVLKIEGFIASFEEKPALPKSGAKKGQTAFNEYEVSLKYFSNGDPAISMARRVSTSGRRFYTGSSDLPSVKSRLGISIVSTSQGVMSDKEARKKKIGGEVLALIS